MEHLVADKSVVVTGAANGIGLAIARRFCELGANVILADSDEPRLEAEVEALQQSNGQAQYFCGNLREKLTVNNLMAATVDAYDKVDVLVNAHRQVIFPESIDDQEQSFEESIHYNVTVNLRLAQAAAKRMCLQKPKREHDEIIGTIINLSSVTAERSRPELLGYSVSSAALNQLTRSLALMYAQKGIRVNGIAMGSILSASLKSAMRESDELHDKIVEATPLGYIGEADEVADAAIFLATKKSHFITGQTITIDGGRGLLDPVDIPAH